MEEEGDGNKSGDEDGDKVMGEDEIDKVGDEFSDKDEIEKIGDDEGDKEEEMDEMGDEVNLFLSSLSLKVSDIGVINGDNETPQPIGIIQDEFLISTVFV